MLDVAFAFALSGNNNGKSMLLTELVTGTADLVVAALIGVVVLVINKADRIENQMIVDMPLVDVGGKYILVLTAQYFLRKLYTDFMGFFGGNFSRFKRLNQMAAQVGALVNGLAPCPGNSMSAVSAAQPKEDTRSFPSVFSGLQI